MTKPTSPIMAAAQRRVKRAKQSAAAKAAHAGHTLRYEVGEWGPHTARYVCVDCNRKHVKWCKKR